MSISAHLNDARLASSADNRLSIIRSCAQKSPVRNASSLLINQLTFNLSVPYESDLSSSLEIHRYPALSEYDGYLSQLLPSLVNQRLDLKSIVFHDAVPTKV